MIEPTIHVVVFREGGWWIVHLLEYDLASCVRRLEEVEDHLKLLIVAQTAGNLEIGTEPFYGFAPSPRRYWKAFEAAQVQLEAIQIEFPPDLAAAGPAPSLEPRIAASHPSRVLAASRAE
jgi:hypothetical protein